MKKLTFFLGVLSILSFFWIGINGIMHWPGYHLWKVIAYFISALFIFSYLVLKFKSQDKTKLESAILIVLSVFFLIPSLAKTFDNNGEQEYLYHYQEKIHANNQLLLDRVNNHQSQDQKMVIELYDNIEAFKVWIIESSGGLNEEGIPLVLHHENINALLNETNWFQGYEQYRQEYAQFSLPEINSGNFKNLTGAEIFAELTQIQQRLLIKACASY